MNINKEVIVKQTNIKHNEELVNRIDDLTYSFDSIVRAPAKMLLMYKKINEQLVQLEVCEGLKDSNEEFMQSLTSTYTKAKNNQEISIVQ